MRILVSTSTFPMHGNDPVPDFILQQIRALRNYDSEMEFFVHAPYNHDSHKAGARYDTDTLDYQERRFHYFFPPSLELLAGRGIMSALKSSRWLYLLIPFFFFFHATSLLLFVKKVKPDIVYAHWFTPQAINAAIVSRVLGVPFLFTTHASDISVLKKLPFSRYLVGWVCKRAKCYTAVSENTANKLRSFFSDNEWETIFSKKLSIIPMGINPPAVKFDLCDCNLDKSHQTQAVAILFIGRFVEKKGVPDLIRALTKVPVSLQDNISVVIAGEGPERPFYDRLIAECGLASKIRFSGFVRGCEKNRIYQTADVVCIPSIVAGDGDEEGLPVVLMEALSYGKVIIASSESGAPTVIDHGVNGFIFNAGDASDLSQLLELVAKLDMAQKQAIGQNAMKLSKSYEWSTLAPQYHCLLSS